MGVITSLFSGLVVRWYSWISEQVMVKENKTWHFSSVVNGWRSAILELVLPSNGTCSCVGIASHKLHQDYFSQFGWCF